MAVIKASVWDKHETGQILEILTRNIMPILLKEGKAILFIHVPKCGGSSFEKEMEIRGWKEIVSVRGINGKDLEFLRCTPQHMHAKILDSFIDINKIEKNIAIVRNPFNRLLSEFSWQKFQGITNLSANDWLDTIFEKYEKNNFIFDNHIRPQTEFLFPNTKFFKLEDDGISKALEYIGAGDKKFKINKSTIIRKIKGDRMKKTKKTLKEIQAFEDRKTDIENFYHEDYLALGYEKGHY